MAYFKYTVKDISRAIEKFDLKSFNAKFSRPGTVRVNQDLYKKFIKKYPGMFESIAEFCFVALLAIKGSPIRKAITCPICKRRRRFPSITCGATSCLVEQRKRARFAKVGSLDCRTPESIEAQRNTLLERYGVTSPFASKEIRQKGLDTLMRERGVDHPMHDPSIKKKVEDTCKERYGTKSVLSKGSVAYEKIVQANRNRWGVDFPFQHPDIQNQIQEHRRLPETERKIQATKRKRKSFHTSAPEDRAYDLLVATFPEVKRQYRSKKYPFACDFYIPKEKLYIECNFHWTHGREPYKGTQEQKKKLSLLKGKGTKYYKTACRVWTKADVEKRATAKEKGLNWVEFFRLKDLVKWLGENYPVSVMQLRPGKRPIKVTVPLVGVDSRVSERFRLLYEACLDIAFPGTEKWPWNHPIWKCRVAGRYSPWEAWQKPKLVEKAVLNLEKIWTKGELEGKYENYITRWSSLIQESEIRAAQVVLNRFTVAKIAPKVTAISKAAVLSILKQTGLSYASGIYCPMAGFGGIVRAAQELGVPVEAYDINNKFNKWYGWSYRNVLAQKIHTDKIVVVCPPFGEKTERWPGTPKEMYFSFEEWCKLIRKYIRAPNYVFIGPEIRGGKTKCGLFSKSLGIQWYPDL